MNILLTDRDSGNVMIDDCYIHKYENVCSYSYAHCKSELSINVYSTENEVNNDDIQTYFIFDCPGTDALIHWIAECFIFYPFLIQITKTYPNIKILTTNKKKYVRSTFRFFHIDNEIVDTIHKTNICFFPPVVSLNDLSVLTDVYSKYIQLYIENVNLKLSYYNLPTNKILLLPRNSKDNYKNNDRIIPGIEDIEENILDIGGVVLNTFQLNNLSIQWEIVANSDIIILDFGSSFFFNCMFLKNKKIILLNNWGGFRSHTNDYIATKILADIIIQNNTVHVIEPNHGQLITYKDIVQYL